MWNEHLARLAETYPTGILSSVAEDGYPLSVRCTVQMDRKRRVCTFPNLPPLAENWRGKACLLFHQHNERLEGLRQLVILGELVQEEEGLLLRINKFVTANGRQNTDQMPHASSPLHMLQFFRLGRRNAHAYITRRGTPWPPIPYDEIGEMLADEEDS